MLFVSIVSYAARKSSYVILLISAGSSEYCSKSKYGGQVSSISKSPPDIAVSMFWLSPHIHVGDCNGFPNTSVLCATFSYPAMFASICERDKSIPWYSLPRNELTMPRTLPPANGSIILPPFGENQCNSTSASTGSNMLVPVSVLEYFLPRPSKPPPPISPSARPSPLLIISSHFLLRFCQSPLRASNTLKGGTINCSFRLACAV